MQNAGFVKFTDVIRSEFPCKDRLIHSPRDFNLSINTVKYNLLVLTSLLFPVFLL